MSRALSILAQRFFDELEVVLVMLLTKGHAQELAESLGNVVGEPVAIEHGDDIIFVGDEG